MKILESDLYKCDLKKAVNNVDLSALDGKTIFITGGLGLICSTVVDLLLTYAKTGTIYLGARSREKFNDRFGGFENVSYVEYDALEKPTLNFKPDFIIAGAGLASPELYTTKPVETLLSNIDGIHNLLRFVMENRVERLLYISSSEVYGKKSSNDSFKEGIYGEIDIDNIRSSYAVAKRASEMLCKAYCSEYDTDVVIVRPGHIYGPSAQKEDRRVSSEFAYKAAAGEKIIMKSLGLQNRSYCYSVDCAVQILIALLLGEKGQVYNIGHDDVTTIREMAEILAMVGHTELVMDVPSEEEIKMFNPMDNSTLDNSKLKNLGYKDSFTTREGILHTVEILKEFET